MKTEYEFTVPGVPQPKGSAKAFLPFHLTRALMKAVNENWRPGIIVAMIKKLQPIVMSTNSKVKAWEKTVGDYVALDFEGPLWTGPVELSLHFYLPRPKCGAKRIWHVKRPDLDKLVRAVADALTGVVYEDDNQVVRGWRQKEYELAGSTAPGVVIRVVRLENEEREMDFKKEEIKNA